MLLLVIVPQQYMDNDMGCWRDWAIYIHEHGLGNIYHSDTTYFPLYMYVLQLFGTFQGSAPAIAANINYIKFVSLFFDFLPVIVLCCFRQRLFPFKVPYLFLLLNIAYLFNSLVWGQMDSIHTSLCFLAILVALRYPVIATLLLVLAINTKPQAFVFLPVVIVTLLYSIRTIKTLLLCLLSAVVLQALILLPFALSGTLGLLLKTPLQAVDLFPQLSISAYNFWYLVCPTEPYYISHKEVFFILTYKQTGLLLFALSSLLPGLTLLFRLLRRRMENSGLDKNDFQLLFLATGLINLYFFYFNSQMHERYAHPVIILSFFYAVLSRNYGPYIILSIAYFLSLDKAFPKFLPIIHYDTIYNPKVLATWYTLGTMYASYLFYTQYRAGKELKHTLLAFKNRKTP